MMKEPESKIRKVLFNEIFMIIAIIGAILSPIYTLFTLKTDLALLNQKVFTIAESVDKIEESNQSFHREIVELYERVVKIETRLDITKK